MCVSGKWTHFRWCAICWLNENANFSQPQIDRHSFPKFFGCKQAQWGKQAQWKSWFIHRIGIVGEKATTSSLLLGSSSLSTGAVSGFMCECATFVWTVVVRSEPPNLPLVELSWASLPDWHMTCHHTLIQFSIYSEYHVATICFQTLPQCTYIRQLDLRTLWRFHPYHTWIFRNDGWKVLTDDPDSSVQIRSIPMTKAFDEGVKKASG